MAKKTANWPDDVKTLIQETSSYEIIGKDAETACFKVYHSKGCSSATREAAKLKVIRANLRFALKLAMDYHKITGLPVEDFYADGKLGLLEAFYRFDWRTGVKFGSYAVWYLRTRMGSTVQEHDLVRVPVRLRKKVLKAIKDGADVDCIRYGKEAEASIMHTFSMELPIEGGDDDGDPITVAESICDDSPENLADFGHAMELLHDKIDQEIRCELSVEESSLVRHLYGLDREETSLDGVAADTGSSKDWLRKVKTRALEKLRNAHGLDDFAQGIT